MTQETFPKGKLQTLQDEISAELKKVSELSPLNIFTEQTKDIDSEVERALGTITEKDSKMGACIIVLTPRGRVSKPNMPGPEFNPVTILVRVVENVLFNQGDSGTKIPASYYAEIIANALHFWTDSQNRTMCCEGLALVPDDNVVYDITFRTSVNVYKNKQGV